ncbi:MAG TPA: acylneuraminate cytidylyltransferase family protein [Rhizomicrobium sp.]|nr:acylneuraminate cytidylyltransferase family protein [Rhizomicrobium sp.]
MKRILAVIAARGGSKGIPHKNLLPLCGKPLIAWSVEQARAAKGITEVAVSSDSDEILAVAERHGAIGVKRPGAISGDTASSESAWLHALDAREAATGPFDLVLSLQATSPIRETSDLDRAFAQYTAERWDSMLSACEVEDFFNWRKLPDGGADAVNYDWRSRRRRQEIEKRYLENGSFYITPATRLRQTQNRLGGRIGLFLMERHKMFQIDRPEDIKLCEAILKGYGYA